MSNENFVTLEEAMEQIKNRTKWQKLKDWIYYQILYAFWNMINPTMNCKRLYWLWQTLRYGYNDTELWDLDNTITKFILPRLKAFRAVKDKGVPSMIDTLTHSEQDKLTETEQKEYYNKLELQWDDILDQMIQSFQLMHDDKWKTIKEYKQHQKQINQGMKLFAKYFQCLWW